ncbi:MAG: adenylate/guanylate cyclase domain-containing protein [Desulfurivibrionaceae bacterium]|nr:adenylate/guanylate cyclase domain-containing protein [Desulfobulbales bacterium]MDT8334592.1 adenylate/guanylate cyclase domain-containing protein [Desulfurivibrionaceae bacterium]
MVAVFVAAAVAWLYLAGAFTRLEWVLLDKRMSFYSEESEISPRVAVVMIDESSLRDMDGEFGRFPWPRRVYVDFIEFFAMGGARAVVFDLLLTENDNATPAKRESDRALAEATREYGMVYHAAQIIVDLEDEIESGSLNRPMPEDFQRPFAVEGRGFRSGIHNNFSLPFAGLYQAARGIGVVGMDADPDGIYRRLRLFREYHGRLYPALAVAPLLDELAGGEPARFSDRQLLLGQLRIPVDEQENYLVKPYGINNEYSAGGILASLKSIYAGETENLLVDPGEFEDKIVFIGASAAGLEDIKATPISTKTPGVLIHVWAAANLLERDFLLPVGCALTLTLIVVLTLLTVATIFRLNNFPIRAGLPLLYGGGFFIWVFSRFELNIVYEIAPPLAAVAAAYLVSFAYLSFTEGRDKLKVRKLFSRYVSPEIMGELLAHHDEVSLGEVGQTEEMTVLFSDIRGFTSVSEVLSAPQLVDLLNCHFGAMTEAIFDRKGTLDKFIGDALMAFWGAPLKVDDHAGLAVLAALDMMAKLPAVNRELLARGYRAIDIGIGINSGEVVLGNIGSARKMDYTVIGDNVNLASRLEGLTKFYGFPIIISEFTVARMGIEIPVLVVDRVRVKGKARPIRIYAPLAGPDAKHEEADRCREHAELAGEAFAFYQNSRWREAAELYRKLPYSHFVELLCGRCEALAAIPPPEDWDGAYNLETK